MAQCNRGAGIGLPFQPWCLRSAAVHAVAVTGEVDGGAARDGLGTASPRWRKPRQADPSMEVPTTVACLRHNGGALRWSHACGGRKRIACVVR
jgi:hypothetical protein